MSNYKFPLLPGETLASSVLKLLGITQENNELRLNGLLIEKDILIKALHIASEALKEDLNV